MRCCAVCATFIFYHTTPLSVARGFTAPTIEYALNRIPSHWFSESRIKTIKIPLSTSAVTTLDAGIQATRHPGLRRTAWKPARVAPSSSATFAPAPRPSPACLEAKATKVRPEWRRADLTSARGCPGRHLGAASLSQSASWAHANWPAISGLLSTWAPASARHWPQCSPCSAAPAPAAHASP